EAAGKQQLLDAGDKTCEQIGAAEGIATRDPGFTHGIRARKTTLRVQARNPKGLGHNGFKLVDVRDVVDEGKWLARVKEADSGRVSGCQDGRFGDAVKASRRRG